MNILIDIGHPAHVHLFKNLIWQMKKKGHKIIVTARDKECALNLLKHYKIKYVNRGTGSGGLVGKAFNLAKTDAFIYKIAKKFKPDVLIGVNNPYIAHVAWLLRKPSYIFNDTEHAKLSNIITYPFATKIITPTCFKKNLGKKQIRYNGYHELAYLHPKYFKPNPAVLKELGVKEGERYFVLRFVSWKASHDINQHGIDEKSKNELIGLLRKHGKVFISSEGKLPPKLEKFRLKIHPAKMHDVLSYATMYIGEGATMATESAILGTPAVYISSLAGEMGNFTELEKEYDLIYSCKTYNKAIKKIKELLRNKKIKEEWRVKRQLLLQEKTDMTRWITGFVEEIMNNK